jgi:flagellum-specific ATP synthase
MSELALDIEKYLDSLEKVPTCQLKGKISQAIGLTLEASGPRVKLGNFAILRPIMLTASWCCRSGGFKNNKILLMPLAT